MEFLLGGIGACGAGFFTNPLEVVKTRMQLQGELKAKGHYYVHYRSVFHAFVTIGKSDGLLALQKGLVPAIYYQFLMNGMRLGSYQVIVNAGLTESDNQKVKLLKNILAGGIAGCVGAFVGSPVYMIKTHLQSQSAGKIAVGHQHQHHGFHSAFTKTYNDHGLVGLWRGVSGAIPRVMVGSSIQLATFSTALEFVHKAHLFDEDSSLNALIASMLSGVLVVAGMTPFDVVSTRLYNQGVNSSGKGLLYTGFINCFYKIAKTEGVWGFYKGWAPSFIRLAPHTVLSLVFWQELRKIYAIVN